MEKLKISVKLHCEPKPVFTALLNAAQHSKITETTCTIEPSEKSHFNLLNGKVKGKSRPGRVNRAGASCSGSVTSLRQKAKQGGERGKMYHWCANMKSGKKK